MIPTETPAVQGNEKDTSNTSLPVTATTVVTPATITTATEQLDQAILKSILADNPPLDLQDILIKISPQLTTSPSSSVPSSPPPTTTNMSSSELPQKPPKPLTPYMKFSRKSWEDYRKSGATLRLKDAGRLIADAWRNLEENERMKYHMDYEKERSGYVKQMENYKKIMGDKVDENSLSDQVNILKENESDIGDPLINLIKQIDQLKQTNLKEAGELGADLEIAALNQLLADANTSLAGVKNDSGNETCPNVNPFPLASLLNPKTNSSNTNTSNNNSASESPEVQKQFIQQRLLDRLKGNTGVSAVTTLTTSSFSPIPAVRLEPYSKSNIQSNVCGAPNYTAVPLNTCQSVSQGAYNPPVKQTVKQKTDSSRPAPVQGVMTNEQCLDMFQNIKKQISDQSIFALTATIHQTSHDNEGLILVVTRNKIDIHPQFGPVHVARVVITNKLYYKFFVLDKIVDSGQVNGKEISEVFWKLSEVSKHLLCPGFNQRYISKVEQTLGEKVDDISHSYCRLTATKCAVWHRKDSKPGQKRNYHTRDLCAECLDLYHRLQFKTYSLKVKQTGKGLPNSQQTSSHKRELSSSVQHDATKKAKLNSLQNQQQIFLNGDGNIVPFVPDSSILTPGNNSTTTGTSGGGDVSGVAGGGGEGGVGGGGTNGPTSIIDQQLKAVLSNLVAGSNVIQVNKETDCDVGDVDILGEDSHATVPPSTAATDNPTAGIVTTTSVPPILPAPSINGVYDKIASSLTSQNKCEENISKIDDILNSLSELQKTASSTSVSVMEENIKNLLNIVSAQKGDLGAGLISDNSVTPVSGNGIESLISATENNTSVKIPQNNGGTDHDSNNEETENNETSSHDQDSLVIEED